MNNKTYLTQIYKDEPRDITLSTLIDEYSTWKDLGDHHDFPVFEMKTIDAQYINYITNFKSSRS